MELSRETRQELLACCTVGELQAALEDKTSPATRINALGRLSEINSTSLGIQYEYCSKVQFVHDGKVLVSTHFCSHDLRELARRADVIADILDNE